MYKLRAVVSHEGASPRCHLLLEFLRCQTMLSPGTKHLAGLITMTGRPCCRHCRRHPSMSPWASCPPDRHNLQRSLHKTPPLPPPAAESCGGRRRCYRGVMGVEESCVKN